MYRFNMIYLNLEKSFVNLNTTNVSVQSSPQQESPTQQTLFKYNKCIGSIRQVNMWLKMEKLHLNTTNVSVQFEKTLISNLIYLNLNTTNVSVQQALFISPSIKLSKFKYNKCIGSMGLNEIDAYLLFRFKYNKCIGSIYIYMQDGRRGSYLNTTNVSVQYM